MGTVTKFETPGGGWAPYPQLQRLVPKKGREMPGWGLGTKHLAPEVSLQEGARDASGGLGT